MKHKRFFFSLIFYLLISSLYAQNVGGIKGKIIDSSTKQPLVGANVSVMDNNNSLTKYGANTDETGEYLINNVPENIYKLKISYVGYNVHIESDVRVVRAKIFSVREIELIESPIIGKELVISQGYFDTPKDMPVSSYNYTGEEIVRSPGAAGDIFRALEVLPGVSTSGGEFSAFSVRGDTPKENIILIDNLPFDRVSHFSEVGGYNEIQGGRFSIFSQGMIDKAQFQAGGFSSQYGGKRASLLSLNIKEGNKNSPSLNASYDLMGWEVKYDGPVYIEPNTGILFSARKVDFGTILKLIKQEGDGDSKFSDFILKSTTDINSANKLSLLGIYSSEQHLRDASHFFKGNDSTNHDIINQKEDKTLLGINRRTLVGAKGFINTSLYYSQVKIGESTGQIYTDPIYNRMPQENEITVHYPIYVFDVNEKQFGIKTDFTYNLSSSYILHIGLAVQQIQSDVKVNLNGLDTVYVFFSNELTTNNKYVIVSPQDFNSNFNKKRLEYAAYLETTFSPTDVLDINTGVRLEYDDFSNKYYVSPRISGSYKIGPFTSLNFATGIYYQLPQIRDLAFDIRNLNLKNEKAYHFIWGVSHYLNNDLLLNAELYYKKLENLIVEPNLNNNYAINSGKGYSYGLDLSLTKRFVDNIYGQINYSYSQSKVKDNDKDAYYNSTFNQPHMFNILLGYQINDNWSFSIKWKYATGRPKDAFVIHANVLNNQNEMRYSKEVISKNALRYSDYHSLNFRVDYRHQFSKFFAVTAFVDILNLYNRQNEVGESFEITTGKNKYDSLPMLPTFGLKIEI